MMKPEEHSDTSEARAKAPRRPRRRIVALVVTILFAVCAVRGLFAFLAEGGSAVWLRMAFLLPETRCADAFWQPILQDRDFNATYDLASTQFRGAYSSDEFISAVVRHLDLAGPGLRRELWEHHSRTHGLGETKTGEGLISIRMAGSNGVFYASTYLALSNRQWQVSGLDFVTAARKTYGMSRHIRARVAPERQMDFDLAPVGDQDETQPSPGAYSSKAADGHT